MMAQPVHYNLTMTFDAIDSASQSSTCPVIARQRAVAGVVVQRNYCRMGEDYDCRCNFCCDSSYAAALDAAEKQNASTAKHRAWIVKVTSAFEALSQIGKAVRAAAAPGWAYACMIRDAGFLRQSFGGHLRGFSFRVVGKRGSAKKHFGKIGTCKWVGENEEGTLRIGLLIEGEEKLAYCAASQLERLPLGADVLVEDIIRRTDAMIVRDAIAPYRPKFVASLSRSGRGRRGPMAYVVTGHDRGKHGEVFWIGADKRTGEAGARLGIREASGAVIWASAYDCADQPCTVVSAAERKDMERVAADMAIEGRFDEARTVLSAIRVRMERVAADMAIEGRFDEARAVLREVHLVGGMLL
jgi:hypothetical protein